MTKAFSAVNNEANTLEYPLDETLNPRSFLFASGGSSGGS